MSKQVFLEELKAYLWIIYFSSVGGSIERGELMFSLSYFDGTLVEGNTVLPLAVYHVLILKEVRE